MTRQLLLLLSFPVSLALFGWWLGPSADKAELVSRPISTVEKTGGPVEPPAPRLPVVAPKVVVKAAKNTTFATPEQIAKLKTTVIDVQDTVDSQARRRAFQESGLDTPEHLASALAIVREDYPDTLTKKDTEARVLALHYLELSSHLDAEGCTEMLRHSIAKFTTAPDPRKGKPYLWDLHDVALTCTKLDPKGMQELQRSIEHPKVSAQLKLVLKTKGVI